MRITITSLFVDDQESALKFYTEVVGFEVKHNMPMGEHAWVTVDSSSDPMGPNCFWTRRPIAQ